ncbi:hypothetical protein [Vibrio sp. 99-8-1]|uniref:hypothetical protein n=1 Tax=Vibrio sp. 99-8-1 TaxID=2607602 RepID=UPI001493877C|nr:hypothetical protein [Vibrio sp. 99-8-1]NOI67059.1 hypothetical protein [Vibrio sp. 99-8-1]
MINNALSKEQVAEICAHLEETASMIGAPLYKTKESMVNLEGILLSLKEMTDEEALNGAEFMAGIYLGEVLCKFTGGEWFYFDASEQFTVKINDQSFFPIERVKSFTSNPNDEGLDFYVHAILAKHKKA